MTDYPTGPENGATPGSELWDEPECVRPMGALNGRTDPIAAAGSVQSGAGASTGPVAAPSAQSGNATGDNLPPLVPLDVAQAWGARETTHGISSDDVKLPTVLPIWPPDEWEMLKRIEALEAHVANIESVLAMAVQVATTAADIARGRTAA